LIKTHTTPLYVPLGKRLQQISKQYYSDASKMLEDRGYKGISLAHTALVFNLDDDGTKCTTVTNRAGIKRQSMAQFADDLEKLNYIKRIDDPKDKRAQIFIFTDAGIKFTKEVKEICNTLDHKYRNEIN
jgi:DNA-binding MarR family transcriptional regulator